MRLLGAAIMFTVLALFLGDSVLTFLSEQLDQRRAYRLELAREQTRRIELQQHRDAIIWQKLQGDHQPPTDLGPAMANPNTANDDSAGIVLGPPGRSAPACLGSPPPSP
jgi:hypothetical protein